MTAVQELPSLAAWADVLAEPGPWVAAVDHPFGLPADFVAAVGWPPAWSAYTAVLAALDRRAFVEVVRGFTAGRPAGRKYLRRAVEVRVPAAASPLNVVRPPVGLMLHACSPLLLAADVDVRPCRPRPSSHRVVLEGYPALVVRALVGSARGYKDVPDVATGRARRALLIERLEGRATRDAYGIRVRLAAGLGARLVADAGGDLLDAVCFAVQAAWAQRRAGQGYGLPAEAPPDEGWIADPAAC